MAISPEPADHSLDLVVLPACSVFESGLAQLVLVGWDDRFDPLLPEATTAGGVE